MSDTDQARVFEQAAAAFNDPTILNLERQADQFIPEAAMMVLHRMRALLPRTVANDCITAKLVQLALLRTVTMFTVEAAEFALSEDGKPLPDHAVLCNELYGLLETTTNQWLAGAAGIESSVATEESADE